MNPHQKPHLLSIYPISSIKREKRLCEVCQGTAHYACGNCRVSFYCNTVHASLDWQSVHYIVCGEVSPRYGESCVPCEPSKNLCEQIAFQAHLFLNKRLYDLALPAAKQLYKFVQQHSGNDIVLLAKPYLMLSKIYIGLEELNTASNYLCRVVWGLQQCKSPAGSLRRRREEVCKYEALMARAQLCVTQNSVEEAKQYLGQAILGTWKLMQQQDGGCDVQLLYTWGQYHLGNILTSQGKLVRASQGPYRQVLDIWRDKLLAITRIKRKVAEGKEKKLSKFVSLWDGNGNLYVYKDIKLDKWDAADGDCILSHIFSVYSRCNISTQQLLQNFTLAAHCLFLLYYILDSHGECLKYAQVITQHNPRAAKDMDIMQYLTALPDTLQQKVMELKEILERSEDNMGEKIPRAGRKSTKSQEEEVDINAIISNIIGEEQDCKVGITSLAQPTNMTKKLAEEKPGHVGISETADGDMEVGLQALSVFTSLRRSSVIQEASLSYVENIIGASKRLLLTAKESIGKIMQRSAEQTGGLTDIHITSSDLDALCNLFTLTSHTGERDTEGSDLNVNQDNEIQRKGTPYRQLANDLNESRITPAGLTVTRLRGDEDELTRTVVRESMDILEARGHRLYQSAPGSLNTSRRGSLPSKSIIRGTICVGSTANTLKPITRHGTPHPSLQGLEPEIRTTASGKHLVPHATDNEAASTDQSLYKFDVRKHEVVRVSLEEKEQHRRSSLRISSFETNLREQPSLPVKICDVEEVAESRIGTPYPDKHVEESGGYRVTPVGHLVRVGLRQLEENDKGKRIDDANEIFNPHTKQLFRKLE